MNSQDKRYKKIAKARAKEYIRKRKGYKTREEKRAFKIAEKFRLREWKKGLSALDSAEYVSQMKAFRYYKFRVNLIRNLLIAGALVLAAAILLIVLLLG